MRVVSLLTEKPDKEQIAGLTYATTVAPDREKSRAGWSYVDVIHSVFIVAVIFAILYYFRG